VNIYAFDLNLLKALDALLSHRSVSRAASHMHLSQPAMSNALNRLREALNDPLLVRVGNRMEPTPRAMALAAPIQQALAVLRQAMVESEPFDPATATGSIRLMATDYVAALLLPHLWREMRTRAPQVSLAIVYPSEAMRRHESMRGAMGVVNALREGVESRKLHFGGGRWFPFTSRQ